MSARTAVQGRRSVRRKHRPRWLKFLKIALWVVLMPIIVGASVFLAILESERSSAKAELQMFDQLSTTLQEAPSEIVASDGTVLYKVSEEIRDYAKIEEIPTRLQDAMIAAEDERFWTHSGIDYPGLARTLWTDAKAMRAVQGGSTITMQLAKLVSSKGEKTMQRKVHDMALALELEKEKTKPQILELYMNKVYFGSHAYGIKAAADVYFHKPMDKVTISEAAFLARLVRRPSSWNNLHHKENWDRAISNRNDVLLIMRNQRMISDQEYHEAINEEIKLNPDPPKTSARILHAPYFVQHVISVFHKEMPDARLSEGGYRIETTLDVQMQALAQKEVQRVVQENRVNKVNTAAFVLMNTQGQILAEVGGVDFEKNQYNVIFQGHRQPGSSFKPFVYATALAQGAVHMDDILPNEMKTYPSVPGSEPYTIHNSDGKYSPTIPLRSAFAYSKNVPAVYVISKVGPQNVVRTAHDAFGFVSDLHPGLALAVGSTAVNPLEMAQGISVFALKGDRATPYVIKRIVTPDSEDKQFDPRIVRNVFDPTICEDIDELMRDVVTYPGGTGWRANNVPNAHGKTGTTNDNRDAWFIGYTDGLIGVGWIGGKEHKDKAGVTHYDPMGRSVFGGTVTVQFWASVMKAAHDKYGTKFVGGPAPAASGKNQAPPLRKEDQVEDMPDAVAPQMGPDGDVVPSDADSSPAPPTKTPSSPTNSPNPDDNPMGDEPAPDDPKSPGKTKPAVPEMPIDQYVEVEICAQTGMKAGIYCPETIVRRFKKGHEPKKVSTAHTG